MAEGLGEIAPLAAGFRIHILAEQAEMVAKVEQAVEILDGLRYPAHAGKHLHVPESTEEVSRFRLAKIVIVPVPVKEAIFGPQMFLQHLQVLLGLF